MTPNFLSGIEVPPLWAFTVIGLLFDLIGAVVVLAPDWQNLDQRLKKSGYKLSPFSAIPIIGYPIQQLDRAYRLEYVRREFIQENGSVRQGELGFDSISDIADSLEDDYRTYDAINAKGERVSRIRSPDFQNEDPSLEDSWGTGTSLGGPTVDEFTQTIEREMETIMFRIGGSLLALGFAIQIIVEILENSV